MKDNTALYIGSGLLALFVLPRLLSIKEGEEAPKGFGGIDLSNLFGDIDLGGGLERIQNLIPNLNFDLPDFNLQNLIPDINLGGLIPDIGGIPGSVAEATQNAIAQTPYGQIIGATAGTTTALLTAPAARAIARIGGSAAVRMGAPRALGYLVPGLGWAWLAADLGATAYEAATGQGVPVIGMGEMLGLVQDESGTPTEALLPATPSEMLGVLEGSPIMPGFMFEQFQGVLNVFQGIWNSIFGGTVSAEGQPQGIAETLAFEEAGWGIPEQSSIPEGGNLVYIGGGVPSAPAPFAPSGGVGEYGGYSVPSFSGLGEAGEGEGAIAWA